MCVQVCGGASGLDGCGSCGGLGCVSEDGTSQCGGEGCETIVTRSQKALNEAKNSDQEVLHALREVDKLNKMVGIHNSIHYYNLVYLNSCIYTHYYLKVLSQYVSFFFFARN